MVLQLDHPASQIKSELTIGYKVYGVYSCIAGLFGMAHAYTKPFASFVVFHESLGIITHDLARTVALHLLKRKTAPYHENIPDHRAT